jgi:hypothetical protein
MKEVHGAFHGFDLNEKGTASRSHPMFEINCEKIESRAALCHQIE